MFKPASSSHAFARRRRRVARAAELGSLAAIGLLIAAGASLAVTSTARAAWSPSVTWVDVRVGDLNGDGRADIVGRDAKSGQLWVQDAGGGAFSSRQWGTWDPSVAWVDVQLGDFNGDGLPDIVARDSHTGTWWVSSQPHGGSFSTTAWDTWDPSATWVDVQFGDLNGDGKADIVGRRLDTGQWFAALSTGSSFTTSTTPWDTWDPSFTWVDVRLGDMNGDGRADLAGRHKENGQWFVALSNGSGFTTTGWDTWDSTVNFIDDRIGDFNGDGKADLAGRRQDTGQWFVALSNGSSFTTTGWDTWDPSLTWVDVRVGDLDGDGRADLVGRVKQTGAWYAARSTGSNSFQTTLWDTWDPSVNWVDVQLGDFNGDGKRDIAGRDLQTAHWWVGVSTGSRFITSDWDALQAQTPEALWLPAMLGAGAAGAALAITVRRWRRRAASSA